MINNSTSTIDVISFAIIRNNRLLKRTLLVISNREENFYENCPKVTEEDAKFFDNDTKLERTGGKAGQKLNQLF
jgi:hypothetical protein